MVFRSAPVTLPSFLPSIRPGRTLYTQVHRVTLVLVSSRVRGSASSRRLRGCSGGGGLGVANRGRGPGSIVKLGTVDLLLVLAVPVVEALEVLGVGSELAGRGRVV